MKVLNATIQEADESGFLTPEADELHRNAYLTSSLRQKIQEGRGWEKGLAGMVRHALTPGSVSGEPGWKQYRFKGSDTIFVFESFAEWIADPNGLGTQPNHLIELLQVSPDEADRALADQVRQELKLPVGSNQFTTGGPNNVRSLSVELVQQEAGNSAAGVRRKIRNWIKANPGDPNHGLAQQWLAKLESNPKSRLHQQALREIGIGGERKKLLDVTGVSDGLLTRLHALAEEEGVAIAELLEDALAVYFRMEEEGEPWVEDSQPAAKPPPAETISKPPAPAKSNGHSASASEMTHLPEPGFYGASDLARLLGRKPENVGSVLARSEDGAEIWQRVLQSAPIRVFVRKNRPSTERLEVVNR